MSAKRFVFDSRGQMMKMPGWFSWRHSSRDEHDAARERYLAGRGPAARKRRASERAKAMQS